MTATLIFFPSRIIRNGLRYVICHARSCMCSADKSPENFWRRMPRVNANKKQSRSASFRSLASHAFRNFTSHVCVHTQREWDGNRKYPSRPGVHRGPSYFRREKVACWQRRRTIGPPSTSVLTRRDREGSLPESRDGEKERKETIISRGQGNEDALLARR